MHHHDSSLNRHSFNPSIPISKLQYRPQVMTPPSGHQLCSATPRGAYGLQCNQTRQSELQPQHVESMVMKMRNENSRNMLEGN